MESNYDFFKENSKSKKVLSGKPSIDRPWEKFYPTNVLNMEFPKMTIYDCIYEINKNNLGRIAIDYFDRRITYNEMFKSIDETTKALLAMNVKKGDIVTICMPTTPETIYLFYALSRIGAISNMIDPRTSAEGIKHYINEVDSKLLILLDMFNQKINSIISETSVENIVNISVSDSLPFGMNLGYQTIEFFKALVGRGIEIPKDYKNIKWNDFIQKGYNCKSIPEVEYKEKSAVSIVHTGGTTGVPKGVLLSNDNLNAIAYQYKTSGMHLLPGHKFLNIMPPFIAYGLGCGIHMPLVVGMTTVLIPKFDPKDFANYILKHKPNHMAGVPSHWENLVDNKKIKGKDLSFLITPAVGGDGMKLNLEEEASKFLEESNAPNKIIKGYGITEECSLATACINDINMLGSVGIPLPQNIVSIFEPGTDKELTYGEKGEICITGPTLMLGYYNNKSETDHILRLHNDGKYWIHTEDIGYMTEDGHLFVEGRIKRVIIRHDGFKVFPFMIEKIIAEHPAVKSCIVVGTPDNEHSQGFLPKAHIIFKEEYKLYSDIFMKEIDDICRRNLPEYMIPVGHRIWEEFPLTSIGKVDFMGIEQNDLHLYDRGKALTKRIV